VGHVDFAGSGVVHTIGGFVGLAGAMVLGPRFGKFAKDGKPKAIPGHSITLAALGTFILWFAGSGLIPVPHFRASLRMRYLREYKPGCSGRSSRSHSGSFP
jgi:Amt family ammonium transporter